MFKKASFVNLIVLVSLQFLSAAPAKALDENQQPRIGHAAPLFHLEKLEGDSLAIADLRGKFVVIHFAASW